MSLDLIEYSRLFYEENPLAEAGNIKSTARGHFTVQGLFDLENADAQVGGMDINVLRPEFETATTVLTDVAEGDQIQVRGTNYTIVDRVDDGTGATVLSLQEILS